MNKRWIRILAACIFLLSLVCFVQGFRHPIMRTSAFWGFQKDTVYLLDATKLFLEKGEWFIGILLITFTIVLPVLKYILYGLSLASGKIRTWLSRYSALEHINKWAMLDVFVVALLIVNMKVGSAILVTSLGDGTTWFASSVVLLMAVAWLVNRKPSSSNKDPEAEKEST